MLSSYHSIFFVNLQRQYLLDKSSVIHKKKSFLYSPSHQEATWAVLAMPEVKQQSQKKKEKH